MVEDVVFGKISVDEFALVIQRADELEERDVEEFVC